MAVHDCSGSMISPIGVISDDSRCLVVLSFGLIGGSLAGCTTTPIAPLAESTGPGPVKILVIESPMMTGPGRLQAVLAPKVKKKLTRSDEPIASGIEHAQQHALAAMRSDLAKWINLVVVAPPPSEEQLLDAVGSRGLKSPISGEEAERLYSTTGADALLRFTVTDYGMTPNAWRTAYVTFEVTTTLAIAAVIAYSGSTVAKAAAGAYLVQETLEETAEAYAGFWGLDVVSRPVRIEGELIGLNPVTTLWTTSDTGLSDTRLSRLYRKIQPDERDRQLDQATDQAVKKAASALADRLKNTRPEPEQQQSPWQGPRPD